MKQPRCFSCGGAFPESDGPTHRYMLSSPGCWAAYSEVLAREYNNPAYSTRGLVVDAYAVQHPGSTDRQSIQSVALHLIRICLILERGESAERASRGMSAAGRRKHLFTWLEPPASLGAVTTADVLEAATAEHHKAAVREWANAVWTAWSAHQDTIRSWLPASD